MDGIADKILTRELSHDSVKERGEKYLIPPNGKHFTPAVVNEEIKFWDLLPRKNSVVYIRKK